MPIALLGYLPDDPSITMLGVTRSTNLLSTAEDQRPILPQIMGIQADNAVEDQGDTQDSGFEEPSMLYEDFENTSPRSLERPKNIGAVSS